jgi:hypothetical protein
MIWWNDEGAAGELHFTSGWDAREEKIIYEPRHVERILNSV